MSKYASKRAQAEEAKAIVDALSDVEDDLSDFGDYIAVLEQRVRTGKKKDCYKGVYSNAELLIRCKDCRSSARSEIARLKGLDKDNDSLADFQEQYEEYSELLQELEQHIITKENSKGFSIFKRRSGEPATTSETSTSKDALINTISTVVPEDNTESQETRSKLKECDNAIKTKKQPCKSQTTDDDEPTEDELQRNYLQKLRFNSVDADKLIDQLDKLSAKISTQFLEFKLTGGNYAMAKAKFEDGMILLRSLDPQNPMLQVYNAQIEKWDQKHSANNKKRVFAWIGIVLGLFMFFAFCFLADKYDL